MDITPYLYFDGQCETAFKFYEAAFGGRIVMMLKYEDAPSDQPTSAGTEGRIMHARLLWNGRFLMGSDTPAGRACQPQGFSVAVSVDSPADAERIFAALSEGGTVQTPLIPTFFSHSFGMLQDKFGVAWMLNCEKSTGVTQDKGASKPFVISRTFDAPLARLWQAFTDPDHMRQWWGPKGVTIIASMMDLRPGGRYLYGMRTPDGGEMWGRMLYREIVPMERIVFVNSFSDAEGGLTRHPMAPSWPIQMLSTFTFAENSGKTTFTVEWVPLHPTPEEQATFDGGHASMHNGWTGTLDQLEAYLGKS
ncbi:MAG: SRPBCC domain-containing protein [Hyphomicrobiaceae bacterium]|nr:SRPBCC domain-containing protein [Hyphomicrobiaceae bacterium]